MRKLATFVGMVAVMMVAAGVAFSDQTVPFPFWQHGYGVTTFWSISNVGQANAATVTINLRRPNGSLVQATTGTIANMNAWLPDTGAFDGWYTSGNNLGWGTYAITSAADTVYLWECIYGLIPWGQTGFTVIMPQNPYGVP